MTNFTPGAGFPDTSQEDWQDLAVQALKGRPIETLVTKTADGIDIQPIYPAPDEAFCATFSQVKGQSAPWCVMQRADIPGFTAANEQILDDLTNGASGIALVVAGAATAAGYGVEIGSARDIKKVFENVDLDLIDVRLDGAGIMQGVAADLLQVYKDRNLDLSRCRLRFGIDPVADFARTGCAPDMVTLAKQVAATLGASRDAGHKGAVFSADTRVFHNAGASPALELGLGLATLIEHMRLAETAGVAPQDYLSATAMMFGVGEDQFSSIAKLRAAHMLWDGLLQKVGAAPRRLFLEAETSLPMMSRRDAHVNMLRTTTACFAAGVGGASSITVLPYSIAAGLPDGFARRIARNQQTVLVEESGIGRVSDAATGSGYVEALTGALAERGWQVMQDIERAGGILAGLSDGLVAELIGKVVETKSKNLATRRHGLVGISEFASIEEPPVAVLDERPAPAGQQTFENAQTCAPLGLFRPASLFEDIVNEAKELGDEAVVFLATIGTPADYATRASWATNLFAAGGIDAGGARDKSRIACICSSDAIYNDKAADLARSLKQDGFAHVYLTGKPGENEQALREAGVDEFLYAGCNVPNLLANSLDLIRKNAS